MKKVFITIGVLIFVLFVALLVTPTFFKSDILRIIQNQSSRYIRAELKIGDMNLSMLRHFPDLNVTLKDVRITGENEFAGDTAIFVPLLEASVNLKSLISGNEVVVNRILLKDARLLPTVDTSGNANWDIFITDNSETVAPTCQEPDQKKKEKGLQLKDISIENLYLSYKDYHTSTYASISDVNLNLKGNLSEAYTSVDILLNLNNISFRHQNSVWVNKTDLKWQAQIGANFKEKSFDIQKNDLRINDLQLDLTGNISFKEDKYKLNIQLNAPDTKFESLLTLIPKSFQHYLEGVETHGEFKLNASAKGEYYENHLPAFEVNLMVHNGFLKYPDLPESIQNINISLQTSNPGGTPDSTQLELKKMSFEIAGNPFNMFLKIKNPNEPQLKGGATGVINFASLKKALPLKGVTLQGILTTDLSFNGKYEYIEKEQYEKFIAKGSVVFKDVLFVNADFPQGISIPQGSMIISPSQLNLNKLQAKIFSSDFLLQGYIANYLPYIFKNETLKGNFSLTSNHINLNEFIIAQMQSHTRDTLTASTDSLHKQTATAAEGALEIPRNINIQLSTDIKTIIFDRLSINNVKGKVSLAQAAADLTNLNMELLKGYMTVNGKYSTVDPRKPTVDFNLNISDFDVQAAYQSFTFIRKSIPMAMNCSGKISAAMKFAATLDQEMSPIMNTANGSGFLESQGILITDNPAMKQLASVLKNDELSRLSISHLKINFKLENGNIIVDPFKTNFAGNPVTIYGQQSVEGNLDYTLSMNINRKFFGKDINNLLKSIPGSKNIQSLDVDAKIEGTLTKPVIKPDLSKAIKTVTKEAEKELKGNLLNGLQNLFKKK